MNKQWTVKVSVEHGEVLTSGFLKTVTKKIKIAYRQVFTHETNQM